MSSSRIKRILKKGLENTVPILQYRQILITNYLALLSTFGTLSMAAITAYFSFYSYSLTCLMGGMLYLPVFRLNEKRHYKIASHYFIILSVLIILILAIISIIKDKNTGVEYVLFAVLAIYVLLFDSKTKDYFYWITFSALFGLKIFQVERHDQTYGFDFIINSLNLLFIAVLLFFFLRFFKRLLFHAVEQSNVHEETLYALLDNVPVYMALVDKNGVYKIANKAYSEQFGMEKDDIIGKVRSKVLPDNIYDKHEPYFQKALQGDTISFIEQSLMPSGDTIYARGKYVPVKNEEGEVIAVTLYVDDVSELKEAEGSLKRANETKDKLFSIIAHDIKSPLNLFQSLLNVSDGNELSKEDFFKYQSELKDRLEVLGERLDELLEWARMQMGGINAYPSMVDINQVIKENLSLFNALINKKGISFDTHLGNENLGWIDENHLRIVLRNLIHNAIKFSKADGKISLTVQEDDDSILIEIKDSGAGMTQEMVNSILKKELQKSTVGTSGEVGTGLGLSLSIGLLEKNSSILSLDSRVGKGTIFRIWVPKFESNQMV